MANTTHALPERGKTLYGSTDAIPSTYDQSIGFEGVKKTFRDVDFAATTSPKPMLSGLDVDCVLVRNASASALTPGLLVKYTTGYHGRRVAITSSANEACAGIVDPSLPAAGVRVGDLFWMIVKGPTLVSKTTGGGTDHAYMTAIVTNNAGLGAASGTPADATAATALALNTVGRVLVAPTTAATTMRIFADVRFSG